MFMYKNSIKNRNVKSHFTNFLFVNNQGKKTDTKQSRKNRTKSTTNDILSGMIVLISINRNPLGHYPFTTL